MTIQKVFLCNRCGDESPSILEAAIHCEPEHKFDCGARSHRHKTAEEAEACDVKPRKWKDMPAIDMGVPGNYPNHETELQRIFETLGVDNTDNAIQWINRRQREFADWFGKLPDNLIEELKRNAAVELQGRTKQ